MKLNSGIAIALTTFVLTACTVTQQQSAYYNAGMSVANSAAKSGDIKTAETEYLIAVQRARRSLGQKELAEALYSLGQFYRHQGRTVGAISAFLEALPIEERIFGPEDVRTGEVLAELAATYLAGIELNEAKPLIERLRPIAPKYTGDERKFVEMLFKAVEPNPVDIEAISDLTPRAAAGDKHAQFELGVFYELGRGVQQDYAKAHELYLSAANNGLVEAIYYLGVVYDKGRGVPVDDQRAASWYRKAADAGYPIAQYNYGVFLSLGRGEALNLKLALDYFRKAAAQGYPSASAAIRRVERELAEQTRTGQR